MHYIFKSIISDGVYRRAHAVRRTPYDAPGECASGAFSVERMTPLMRVCAEQTCMVKLKKVDVHFFDTVMTTGLAGGLSQPYKGMLPAVS